MGPWRRRRQRRKKLNWKCEVHDSLSQITTNQTSWDSNFSISIASFCVKLKMSTKVERKERKERWIFNECPPFSNDQLNLLIFATSIRTWYDVVRCENSVKHRKSSCIDDNMHHSDNLVTLLTSAHIKTHRHVCVNAHNFNGHQY